MGCFRMDSAMTADRLRALSRSGCTSDVLELMQEFGKRCSGIHSKAMPLNLRNRSMFVGWAATSISQSAAHTRRLQIRVPSGVRQTGRPGASFTPARVHAGDSGWPLVHDGVPRVCNLLPTNSVLVMSSLAQRRFCPAAVL